MKKIALIFAALFAVMLMMTGCFHSTQPAPTAAPTMIPTATVTAAPTAVPTVSPTADATAAPDATIDPEVTDGLKVAPSPSATTEP